jgi:ketosteroid isomerase-like protein
MKKNFIILCLMLCTNYLLAQDDSTAIRDVMNKQIEAWNNGDIDTFMQTYWKSDSLLFVSAPPTYGWQTTLERYKKYYPDTAAMGKLSFNLIKLNQLSPEYYFVIGEWHLKRSVGDVGGYFTLLFKKINDNWVIVVDHTS